MAGGQLASVTVGQVRDPTHLYILSFTPSIPSIRKMAGQGTVVGVRLLGTGTVCTTCNGNERQMHQQYCYHNE